MSLLLQPVHMLGALQQNLSFHQQWQFADAAVLLAITQEENPQILLTRRTAQMRLHAGEVSLPGGKREMSDENNIAVALREAQEETALNPNDVQLLGELPTQKSRSGIRVKPIVGIIPPRLALVPQPSEIDRIFFMPLQQFMLAAPEAYLVKHQQQEFYFPSIHFDNEIVWGLTARILVSLLDQGLCYQKEWPFLLNTPET
ncbi:CoA pyrophosphatase [Acinetobacter qingfengensis]|uniref:Coenzyme A pyrophosphatase n=1 Tax=Acinetobacter qingfengensis TaxID=1262585 RepID=A0A1E7RG36_9GAMM|nr:CoA pyrophosphatase [Acinetobacter qingfengensis]KAA8731854.1 CoA pyrophosphatase [Acinetobacter qingfengensis]OEY98212.1 coenzyme A pyrophosphatase [Acinetobacter qingfengensis]